MTSSLAETFRLLTIKQAAAALSLSTRKIWELTNRGEIPSIRIGRAVRYSIDDLKDYIARQRSGGAK